MRSPVLKSAAGFFAVLPESGRAARSAEALCSLPEGFHGIVSLPPLSQPQPRPVAAAPKLSFCGASQRSIYSSGISSTKREGLLLLVLPKIMRVGYFCVDNRDSAPGHLVFNRSVALKDGFKA